jgi:hypothetical protein
LKCHLAKRRIENMLLPFTEVTGHCARFDKLALNLDKYVGHKIQDAHMTESWTEELKELEPVEVAALGDYAAKRMGLRTVMEQADGYGQGAGRLSQHITTIWQKGRACDFPDITLSEEDLKETYVMTMYNTCTDNASQGPLHASMVMKRALAVHHKVWANKEDNPITFTKARLRSDNAGDYQGNVFMMAMLVADTKKTTGMIVVVHTFSIAGEGKAVNDMKNGHISQVGLMEKSIEQRFALK